MVVGKRLDAASQLSLRLCEPLQILLDLCIFPHLTPGFRVLELGTGQTLDGYLVGFPLPGCWELKPCFLESVTRHVLGCKSPCINPLMLSGILKISLAK